MILFWLIIWCTQYFSLFFLHFYCLKTVGEGTLGTDEETFTTVLAHQSFYQLKLVFDEYEKLSGKTFQQAVESELGGDLKEAILTIARRAESLPRYFAERLKEAMKGVGTDEDALIRIIVSRSEIDLGAIRKEYMALYHKTLESAVKDETGGDFEKALISILEGNWTVLLYIFLVFMHNFTFLDEFTITILKLDKRYFWRINYEYSGIWLLQINQPFRQCTVLILHYFVRVSTVKAFSILRLWMCNYLTAKIWWN